MTLNLDRSTWLRVRFGDVVRNVNDTVREPAAAGVDRVVAMEHLDPGELKVATGCGALGGGRPLTCRPPPEVVDLLRLLPYPTLSDGM